MAKATIITATGESFEAETTDVPDFLQNKVFCSCSKPKADKLSKTAIHSIQPGNKIAAAMLAPV